MRIGRPNEIKIAIELAFTNKLKVVVITMNN